MYNDLDDELLDDDAFHDECCSEALSFEEFLQRIGKTSDAAKQEYSEFMLWFEAMCVQMGIKNIHKALFCRKICSLLKNERSIDLKRVWCLCLSDHSDFLFEKQQELSDNDYMEYRIMQCYYLKEDIDNLLERLKSESLCNQQFDQISKSISFSNETFLNIDVERLYKVVTEGIGLKGKHLKDNMIYACDKISHSAELSQIAPVVLYSLFTRYNKKMSDTGGFIPNFKAVIGFRNYIIDENNGKNQDSYMEHIIIYQGMCSFFSDCDRTLCDVAFANMSNLVKNDNMNWYEFPLFKKPLLIELEDNFFTCFPNGLDDNPAFLSDDVSVEDMIAFEEYYDSRLGANEHILRHVREYLSKDNEPAEQYIRMIELNETNQCMKIIHDIIEKSDVKPENIKPEMSNIVNAAIMEETLANVNDRMKKEMLDFIPIISDNLN